MGSIWILFSDENILHQCRPNNGIIHTRELNITRLMLGYYFNKKTCEWL